MKVELVVGLGIELTRHQPKSPERRDGNMTTAGVDGMVTMLHS